MPFHPISLLLCALFFVGVATPAVAQTTVYKCERAGTVTYSEQNCRGRIINTEEAPVPVRARPKAQESQDMAQAMTPLSGESSEQFALRRHRAALLTADREECARLDKRMPVEEGMLTNPDPQEVSRAREALGKSRKRFAELRC